MADVLAIIPARGGSKGIPKKNIVSLGGFPLIAYSIAVAKLSKEINRIIVSTDDIEIAEIAKRYGAEVPFLRPSELAADNSTDLDFVNHALTFLKEKENYEPALLVHLRPTTPLRDPFLIDIAIEKIKNDENSTSLRSAHELEEPPYKYFKLGERYFEGFFEDFEGIKDYTNLPRQRFPRAFHPNGYVDIIKPKFVQVSNSLHGTRILPLITPFSEEIDTRENLEHLKYLLEREGHLLLKYLNSVTNVEKINTRFRKIVTEIPNPNSIEIIEETKKYETRCMHGQLPIVWDKAKDFQVFDKDGNCWIDFTSTIFLANAGHSNPEIKKAIQKMLDQDLLHSYTYITEVRRDYLKKLSEFTKFEKAFLLSAGTEATECAIKLMKLYGKKIGKRRGGIISFNDAMHGRTMGAQLIGGNEQKRDWIGFDDSNIHRLEFPYPWTLFDEKGSKISGKEKFLKDIKKLGERIDFDKDVAGIIVEAYIGWGAVLFPEDYIQEMRKFAKEHEILFCVDEIQGGFGRTGKLFTYENYDIRPDIVCCGKGISSSLPLSAVLGSKDIMDTPELGSMSSTHSANPLSCAAGLANINFLERENIIKKAEEKGKLLHKRLNEIKMRFPDRISYVLGKGLLAGVLFVKPGTKNPDGEIATKICNLALKKGLLLVHTGRESIKIGPPLTIPEEALLEGLDVFEECILEAINEI